MIFEELSSKPAKTNLKPLSESWFLLLCFKNINIIIILRCKSKQQKQLRRRRRKRTTLPRGVCTTMGGRLTSSSASASFSSSFVRSFVRSTRKGKNFRTKNVRRRLSVLLGVDVRKRERGRTMRRERERDRKKKKEREY